LEAFVRGLDLLVRAPVLRQAEPARWIARISRFDGKIIRAGHDWQNAFYDTIASTTATEATKYAEAALDGHLIR
jgi:hypothetical protein